MKSYLKQVSIICPCYKGEPYLEAFLESVSQQTIIQDTELILDHNEPSEHELSLVADYERRFPGSIVHRIVRPVVPIGASMNNCIRAASGKYMCIWNIDDHRTPDSLERMCQTLEANPDIGFTYGDYVEVNRAGKDNGRPKRFPEFARSEFTRRMLLGPFFMWRAELVPRIGFFDEQLRSAADFDLAVRLAFSNMGKKTPGNLGFYLYAGQGASQGAKHLVRDIALIERTAVELRYGAYDMIARHNEYRFIEQAKRYRIRELLINGEWQPVERYVPNYQQMMLEREPARQAFEAGLQMKIILSCAASPFERVYLSIRSRLSWQLAELGLLERIRARRDTY
jgi:glycosyltransferase involved in cell wall biosynthesis